jgi:hypothetical protein
LLIEAQQRALEAVRALGAARERQVRSRIRLLLARNGIAESEYESALHNIRRSSRVALHFHPERLDRARRSVAQGLLDDGTYKNQFDTGLSSGSPSAFRGGEDSWEQHLFGGAYHGADVTAADRPKYGSLDLLCHPDGPSPRFGSCYLLLKPEVSERTTFTFGGSQEHDAADRTGTLELLDPVSGPVLATLEHNPRMLAPDELSIAGFLARLKSLDETARVPSVNRPLGRVLDYFVEAQVHGVVALRDDVESLVGDAAFRGHPVGDVLRAVAQRYQFPLHWHQGFRLPMNRVPALFREYSLTELAERAAVDGVIDAITLGACANSFELESEEWSSWGSHDEMLTALRRLWHVLVLGGRDPGLPKIVNI